MTKPKENNSTYYKILPYLVIGFVVFTQGVRGFYAIYDLNPPNSFTLLSYLILFWLVGDWFTRDSRKTGIEWAYDMGFFLYISWPIFIPFYLYKTRGIKRAFYITGSFIALYLATYLLSTYLLYDIAP